MPITYQELLNALCEECGSTVVSFADSDFCDDCLEQLNREGPESDHDILCREGAILDEQMGKDSSV